MAYKSKVLTVAEGGTGASTLTGVLIGSGTSNITATAITQNNVLTAGASNAINTVAPGSSGNVLKSDGTDWTSGAVTGGISNYFVITSQNVINPADSTSYFLGGQNVTTFTASVACTRMYIATAGTITKCYGSFSVSGTLGSNENSTLAIRLNNTTDTTVSGVIQLTSAVNSFSNTSLSISVSAGDFLDFKWTTPAWVTNPTSVQFSGAIE